MKQILRTNQTTVDFTASGENLLLLTEHAGGTWTLQIVAPSPSTAAIDTGITFTGDGQQRFAVPANTKLRLSSGTAGARAFVGEIVRRYNERL